MQMFLLHKKMWPFPPKSEFSVSKSDTEIVLFMCSQHLSLFFRKAGRQVVSYDHDSLVVLKFVQMGAPGRLSLRS